MKKVYLVGSGPGDPGLITVKAVECITKADVIIYDYLVGEELLKYARAALFTVHGMRQPCSRPKNSGIRPRFLPQDHDPLYLIQRSLMVPTVIKRCSARRAVSGSGAPETKEVPVPTHTVRLISGSNADALRPLPCRRGR